jgi:citrate synthase
MKPFWREEPLTDAEAELLAAVYQAHAYSAGRNNCSSAAFWNSWHGSHDFTKALTGALSTLGGPHAPLREAINVLKGDYYAPPLKIPGWGNSFVRGAPDPIWHEVSVCLHNHFPEIADDIERITNELHARGKKVFPNPSCYTAACCIALRIPAHLAPWLFVSARLDAWAGMLVRKPARKES